MVGQENIEFKSIENQEKIYFSIPGNKLILQLTILQIFRRSAIANAFLNGLPEILDTNLLIGNQVSIKLPIKRLIQKYLPTDASHCDAIAFAFTVPAKICERSARSRLFPSAAGTTRQALVAEHANHYFVQSLFVYLYLFLMEWNCKIDQNFQQKLLNYLSIFTIERK